MLARKQTALLASLASATFLFWGCGAADDEPLPGPAVGGGKADSATRQYPLRLDRSTPDEVAAAFATRMGGQLDACFAGYQAHVNAGAKQLTASVVDQFRSDYPYGGEATGGYCYDTYDLSSTVKALLTANGRSRAYPDTVKGWMGPWALEQLEPATVNGFVGHKDLPLGFYEDLVATETANAMAREVNPTGVDLKLVREAWKQVRWGTTLDRAYLEPVLLDPATLESTAIFDILRDEFPLGRLSLVSSGRRAIADFWATGEGPDGDPKFKPVADALSKSSIRKRFFFAGGGTEWSSHVLVVVDEHGQAFGMQMGYSE